MGFGGQFVDLPAVQPPVLSGTLASRPLACYRNAGAIFVATDTGAAWLSSGSAWLQIASGGGGGGVTSLNNLTGALSLLAGTNVTINAGSGEITISASGGSAGLPSVIDCGTWL